MQPHWCAVGVLILGGCVVPEAGSGSLRVDVAAQEYGYASKTGEEIDGSGLESDGKKVGMWTYFYGSGELLAQGSYEEGEKNGLWRYWRQSGSLWMFGEYGEYSRPNGVWVVLTEDGCIDLAQWSTLKCSASVLSIDSPGGEPVGLNALEGDSLRLVQSILPGPLLLWQGTGYYSKGIRVQAFSKD